MNLNQTKWEPVSSKVLKFTLYFFPLIIFWLFSLHFIHFLMSLYYTNLLTGYSDSKPVINKDKKSGTIIFIYRGVGLGTLYLDIIQEIFRNHHFLLIFIIKFLFNYLSSFSGFEFVIKTSIFSSYS